MAKIYDISGQPMNQLVALELAIEQHDAKIQQLITAIKEYHQAVQEIHTFIREYVANGGDASIVPLRWDELDAIRQTKYQAMLNIAGLLS